MTRYSQMTRAASLLGLIVLFAPALLPFADAQGPETGAPEVPIVRETRMPGPGATVQ